MEERGLTPTIIRAKKKCEVKTEEENRRSPRNGAMGWKESGIEIASSKVRLGVQEGCRGHGRRTHSNSGKRMNMHPTLQTPVASTGSNNMEIVNSSCEKRGPRVGASVPTHVVSKWSLR